MLRSNSKQTLSLFIQEQDVERIATALQRLTALELRPVEEANWAGEKRRHWSELVHRYSELKQRLEKLLQNLAIPQQAVPLLEPLEPAGDTTAIKETLRQAEQQLADWQGERREAEEAQRRLQLLIEEMHLLAPLDIPVEKLRQFRYLYFTVGTLPKDNLESIHLVLFHIPFVIIPFYESADRVLVFAATSQPQYISILDRALRSAFMEPLELPEHFSGAPLSIARELQKQLEQARHRLDELARQRQHLAENWRSPLLSLWQQVHQYLGIARQISQFGQHGPVYLVMGRIAQDHVNGLVEMVHNVAQGPHVILQTLNAAGSEKSQE